MEKENLTVIWLPSVVQPLRHLLLSDTTELWLSSTVVTVIMMVVVVIVVRRAHMVVFLIVMKLLFVICEPLLKKKTTVLLPTINLQSEVAIRGWEASAGWWRNVQLQHGMTWIHEDDSPDMRWIWGWFIWYEVNTRKIHLPWGGMSEYGSPDALPTVHSQGRDLPLLSHHRIHSTG